MAATSSKNLPTASQFATDDDRWQAVVNRDAAAEGAFVYSVKTTGVYCRPTCAARLALRKNICFHATCHEAERAGFRPCKRCRPNEESRGQRHSALVANACRAIEEAGAAPGLASLAESAGMSRFHFQRVFKRQTGVTPKEYAAAHRGQRIRGELAKRATVAQAIYGAGFGSNSRFYESSTELLGMLPKAYRSGGTGTAIRFAIGACWLGSILVAATDRGLCAILLGDDPDELARDLQDRFPKAELIGGDAGFERLVAKVVGLVQQPSAGLDLPLDIRGTAFQQRVWKALREIPAGSTASYTEIAEKIGSPKSVRAVASACAANALAVAIPCHRVVRTDGSLSGYRWGVERKQALLQREKETS